MCGVIGYKGDGNVKLLKRLFYESSIRGTHSFGYRAILEDGSVEENKTYTLNQVQFTSKIEKLIGHNRYCTSGNWTNHKNNQPLTVEGISLVFNGVIDMRTVEEYNLDYPNFRFVTENDGEIFLRYLLGGGDPVKFVKQKLSFAGCWMQGGVIYVLRNQYRPLWYALNEESVIVASTHDILSRAGLTGIELPANKVYTLAEIKREKPCATTSQQAGRLLSIPPSYDNSRRYGPRVSSVALSV